MLFNRLMTPSSPPPVFTIRPTEDKLILEIAGPEEIEPEPLRRSLRQRDAAKQTGDGRCEILDF